MDYMDPMSSVPKKANKLNLSLFNAPVPLTGDATALAGRMKKITDTW